ncbi:hypothetical protein Tco_0306391, partial [Tanacetum coccineum]
MGIKTGGVLSDSGIGGAIARGDSDVSVSEVARALRSSELRQPGWNSPGQQTLGSKSCDNK